MQSGPDLRPTRSCSDRVSVVPVAARGAVGVQPVLQVGLLGPLVQSLHVEHVLLCGGGGESGVN